MANKKKQNKEEVKEIIEQQEEVKEVVEVKKKNEKHQIYYKLTVLADRVELYINKNEKILHKGDELNLTELEVREIYLDKINTPIFVKKQVSIVKVS